MWIGHAFRATKKIRTGSESRVQTKALNPKLFCVVLMLFQRRGSLDIALWQSLREANQPPFVDRELPEEPPAEATAWPKLPLAGVPPTIPRQEIDYRPHV